MFKNPRFFYALLIGLGVTSAIAACGDLEEDECDPAATATCVCTDDESGAACTDPTAEGCTCVDTAEGDTTGGTTGGDTGGTTGGTTAGPTEYGFVLVEDLSTDMTGESPGADIDAISVTISGTETFATGIADFNLGGGSNLDPTAATGAPDSSCTATGFVALGGTGGYLVAEFGTSFKSGDSVTVYELGPTTCPNQAQWIDEDYRVSVSVSSNLADFTEIGQGGTGLNTIVVP